MKYLFKILQKNVQSCSVSFEIFIQVLFLQGLLKDAAFCLIELIIED